MPARLCKTRARSACHYMEADYRLDPLPFPSMPRNQYNEARNQLALSSALSSAGIGFEQTIKAQGTKTFFVEGDSR